MILKFPAGRNAFRVARTISAAVLGLGFMIGVVDAAPLLLPLNEEDLIGEDSSMAPEAVTMRVPKALVDFDDRIRETMVRFGASPDRSTLDLELAFEDEVGNPDFSIFESSYDGSVFGIPAMIEVHRVEDGRPLLESGLVLDEFRAQRESIQAVLSTDSLLRIVDVSVISFANGEQFSARVLHWTPSQQERVECLGFPDSEGRLCGLSIPLDIITPADLHFPYPEPNPIIPPSWSLPNYGKSLHDPEWMRDAIEYHAGIWPIRCMSCVNVPRGICMDEFLAPGSAAALALANFDACVAAAYNNFFDEDLELKLIIGGAVVAACFGVEIVCPSGTASCKVKWPKRPRLPKTWPVWAICGGSVGILGLMIWLDYRNLQAAIALCHAQFARAIREEFDRLCAEP